jgi:hypothetical protein
MSHYRINDEYLGCDNLTKSSSNKHHRYVVLPENKILLSPSAYKASKAPGGVLFGYTCVSGGWSSSFHANQNLMYDIELQKDVVEVCCAILRRACGGHAWYKDLKGHYNKYENKHLKEYLLEDSPCTGIWWSCDGREHNNHVDRNAYGATFLISPQDYNGAALSVLHKMMPDIHCKHIPKLGQVVAGCWSRGLHYIDSINKKVNKVCLFYMESMTMAKGKKVVERTKATDAMLSTETYTKTTSVKKQMKK